MKKRILCMMLASLTLLCSCGHEQQASDKALINAQKAYEISQSYLSGDLSAEDAHDKLEELKENLSYASEYTQEERKSDKQKTADYYLHFYVQNLSLSVLLDKGSGGDSDSYDHVKDDADKLKENIDKYD